jgi:putative membrane protein
MKKILLPLLGISFLFAVACNDSDKTDSTEVADDKNEQMADSTGTAKMEDDHEFMVEAASGGLMEVQLGQLAATNASSGAVKEFGAMMVKDHGTANEELKALAAQKNITLPSTPGNDHQHHIDNLTGKKGADFDKEYMSMMVDDHQEDINKFEEASREAKDADVKAFATKTLPILKQHLEKAKTIKDGLK